jgi:hypothetical protein
MAHAAVAGRVVHQHVESAELAGCGIDHVPDCVRISDVALDDDVTVTRQAGQHFGRQLR